MVGGKQGHAPCRTSSYKNPQNHVSQLLWAPTSRTLGLTAPAYHKKKGATPHYGVCKLSFQYDKRPDERFGVQVETWNLGSLSGKKMKLVCGSHGEGGAT